MDEKLPVSQLSDIPGAKHMMAHCTGIYAELDPMLLDTEANCLSKPKQSA